MESVVFELSIIIISTAVLAFLSVMAKQPLIIAYIFAGILVGPEGLNLIQQSEFFTALSQVGIILLLYLIGLELKPQKFAETIKKSYKIALLSSLAIAPLGILIGWVSGLTMLETTYLSIAFLFSSTVVVIKGMRDEGGVDERVYDSCVGILLIQDLMAVFILVIISSLTNGQGFDYFEAGKFVVTGILFIAMAFFIQRFALRKIIKKVIDRTDLIFLIGLAWCFLFAELAEAIHLSREIGGFIAGLSLTSLPEYKLRVFISKSETIRDFFMILFFFVLGANLRLMGIEQYTVVIFLSLALITFFKPIIYYFFSRRSKYTITESKEIGIRLAQISEFSIIIALLATEVGHISSGFSMVIQLILFLSIIFSNYIVKYFPFKEKSL